MVCPPPSTHPRRHGAPVIVQLGVNNHRAVEYACASGCFLLKDLRRRSKGLMKTILPHHPLSTHTTPPSTHTTPSLHTHTAHKHALNNACLRCDRDNMCSWSAPIGQEPPGARGPAVQRGSLIVECYRLTHVVCSCLCTPHNRRG